MIECMLSEKTTAYYESLINPGDPLDPLARMVRFSSEEYVVKPQESPDPIGDRMHSRSADGRLIHRYPDRVLLLVTDRCAAHCRFCFRKRKHEAFYSDITDDELAQAIFYLTSHAEIGEVILSGGDPLSLSNHRLLELIAGLRTVASLRTIRIHTRYPVYDPLRCKGFSEVGSRVDTVVVHVDHSREITAPFRKAASVLREASLLLNQSTLLKGVNDSVEELTVLSRSLVSSGIIPYYLHYPDMAEGISHFRIPLHRAIGLVGSLQGCLPGYMIPRLVLDLPQGKGKVVLSQDSWSTLPDGAHVFTSPLHGDSVVYRESC